MEQSKPLSLLLAVKRKRVRGDDARADIADAALKAKRPGVLNRGRNTCLGCGYVAKNASHLDVHHLDDDHQNNTEENLVVACHTCHPYQHVGETARHPSADVFGEGLGKQTLVGTVPEIGASDMNLLLRAIGVALNDPDEKPTAVKILTALADRANVTKEMFGSNEAGDFAAGMARITPEEYRARGDVLGDQRLLFNGALLKKFGAEFIADHPTLPLKSWKAVSEKLPRKAAQQPT